MAGGYSPFPSTLDNSGRPRRRTQTKEDQPLPLFHPGSRNTGSTDLGNPPRHPTTIEDPNLDPFYLERSLENVTSWESQEKESRDAGSELRQNGKFMSSDLNLDTAPFPSFGNSQERLPALAYQTPELGTHSSFEHSRYPSTTSHQFPYHHYGQHSFSSVQSDASGNIPDLTPSSSFSSNYSVSNCPEAVLNATKQLCLHTNRAERTVSEPPYLYISPDRSSTGDNIDSYAATEPSTPTGTITPYDFPYNDSSDTLIMHFTNPGAPSASSLRSKPLPSLPNLSRDSNGQHASKKVHSPCLKTQIDPALISPPCLIDPVTMEPHATPYDQALFIPANECPSPVPSPVACSPPITRQVTGHSTRARPSTSTSEAHCEQSVWESDSDSESIGPKSLSRRRPIDTLRKVRSRVQLKVTKSTTKLDGEENSGHESERSSEEVPPMPTPTYQQFPEVKTATNQNWTPEPVRGSVEHTLRLVAPSTTSLPRPSSSRGTGQESNGNEKMSTVAAMHTHRPHRLESEQRRHFPTHEAIYGKCLESQSTIDLNAALSLSRPGLLRRLCRSFRALSCHHVHEEDCYEKTFRR
ncbi:hypothetical protein DTO212C5_1384 [Paecilomyces variotii]|nr:hypothetical protein DTO212C5_1384 [Paecilomyces variotii]